MDTPNLQPDVTIVIPAYREELRIGKTLDELAIHLQSEQRLAKLIVEVLVVAADTPDKTHALVQSKQAMFENLQLLQPGPRVGKGRDVKYGMLRARGKLVIFMDADLATPLHHIMTFYDAAQGGADIVIGTRNLFKHHPGKLRRLLSSTGNLLFKIAGGMWIEDSQCGFKMFTHEAAQICFSKLNIMGWGFDMEVLAIGKANGLIMTSYRLNDWVSVPDGNFEGVVVNAAKSLGELSYILWNRLRGNYRVNRTAYVNDNK